MRLAHVLVCHSVQPTKLFASIPEVDESPWFVYLHSDNRDIAANVDRLVRLRCGNVFSFMYNRGLAKSWNDALALAMNQGCDAVLLLNDDLFFYEESYLAFRESIAALLTCKSHNISFITLHGLETGASAHAGQVLPQSFACCAVTRKAIETIGYFDQNFWPAYFEDVDYARRAALAGMDVYVDPRTLVEHERSSTTRSMSTAHQIELNSAFDLNKNYFERKWGGSGGKENYLTPFAEAKFDMVIEAQRRQAPYGIGFDRSDNDESTRDRAERAVLASAQLITEGTNSMSALPSEHRGQHYTVFMSELSRKRSTKTYLEIGVGQGTLLTEIYSDTAIGVDPHFALNANIATHKKMLRLFQMGSDEFFADPNAGGTLDGIIDLVFLDGMHLFEFLLRDFMNAEAISKPNTLFVLHDCLPLNYQMAQRSDKEAIRLSKATGFVDWWTGDVWKIIPILKRYRPDLRLSFVDCPPTGVFCVTNLDRSSTVLRKNYLSITSEYLHLPNDLNEIENLYSSIEITPSSEILNDNDHSLFFMS